MTQVFFTLEYTILELRIAPGVTHSCEYGGPHDLKVVLRAPSADEQARGHQSEHAFCTATSRVEAHQQNSDMFAQIAANQVLPRETDDMSVSIEYSSPDGTRIRVPALSQFPQHFRSFIENVRGELADHARRTVSVLHWRANVLGPHEPFSTRGLHWSFDGAFWHPAPADLRFHMRVLSELQTSAAMCEQVTQMVGAGESEPLHHNLFREAWEQYDSNPRSALVIGMAAAELAVKRCIATLVPRAEWLATNLPTPPLVRMLEEYLPRLPARHLIDAQVKPPPMAVLESIRKGVTIRNQLSHAGTVSPSSEDVEEILHAVHDVLWLLDYYSGYEWALGFLRAETRSELGAGL